MDKLMVIWMRSDAGGKQGMKEELEEYVMERVGALKWVEEC
jgi:hypothetical protein